MAKRIGELLTAATASKAVHHIDLLVEPFAGGASTSLRLAGTGVVSRVLLADADPLVAHFWQVAAADTDWLIDAMHSEYDRYITAGTGVERWEHWRRWRPDRRFKPATVRRLDALRCLFLNRTTFSGILHGQAGPLGGYSQESEYDIGCRYNPAGLEERLRYVQALYDSGRLVDVWCKDWRDTLADVPEWYPQLVPDHVVAYLDPPYIEKSFKLYQRSFSTRRPYTNVPAGDLHWGGRLLHERLAEHLRTQMRFRWVLSYDAHPSLLTAPALYAHDRMTPSVDDRALLGVKEWTMSKRLVSLTYTAASRAGRDPVDELLITTLPPSTVPLDETFRPVPADFGAEPTAP